MVDKVVVDTVVVEVVEVVNVVVVVVVVLAKLGRLYPNEAFNPPTFEG